MRGKNQFTYKAPSEELLKEIERFAESNSIRDTCFHFGITLSQFQTLRKKNLIKWNNSLKRKREIQRKKSIGFCHSEETKKLLSEKRKKWILENPNKSPYLLSHKSRGETYAERYFRKWLEKEKIPFEQEYRFKLYAFDFLVNKRIDLEIDGTQHRNDRCIIEHDKRRDNYAKEAGFIVYRISWADYCKLDRENKRIFLKNLKEFLISYNQSEVPNFVTVKKTRKPRPKELKTKFFNNLAKSIRSKKNIAEYYDYREYMSIEMIKSGTLIYDVCDLMCIGYNTIRKWLVKHDELKLLPVKVLKIEKIKSNKNTIKSEDNCFAAIKMLQEGKSYLEVAKHFGVSDNAIRKWIRSVGEDPKKYGHNKNNRKNNTGLNFNRTSI